MAVHQEGPRRREALAVAGLAALAAAAAIHYVFTKPMAVRMALPLAAIARMEEVYRDDAPLPDFVHCIRVDLDEEAIDAFLQRMHLEPSSELHDGSAECGPGWVGPSPGAAQRRYVSSGTTSVGGSAAVVAGGKLFYVAWGS